MANPVDACTVRPARSSPLHLAEPPPTAWLAEVRARMELPLRRLLATTPADRTDPEWMAALDTLARSVLRGTDRIPAALVLSGFALVRASDDDATGVCSFAAGVQLVCASIRIRDRVDTGADERAEGPALERELGAMGDGNELAFAVADHAAARGVDAMLDCGLARASSATRCYLAALSESAAGRYLEVAPDALAGSSLRRTLRIAYRKTVSLEFVAPLVAGALLAGGNDRQVVTLRRVGWHAGLAYHLRRDVVSLSREPSAELARVALRRARLTFPVAAAYARAPLEVQRELARLLSGAVPVETALPRVRELVGAHGGLRASERSIAYAARAARQRLGELPEVNGARRALSLLIAALTRREAA